MLPQSQMIRKGLAGQSGRSRLNLDLAKIIPSESRSDKGCPQPQPKPSEDETPKRGIIFPMVHMLCLERLVERLGGGSCPSASKPEPPF